MIATELVTAEEVGKALGVSRYTVKQWARENRIPYIRISHKVLRFSLPDIYEALRARQMMPTKKGGRRE